MNCFEKFSEWLDRQLKCGITSEAVAVCFNLYENDESYSFQLIASDYYYEDDSNWPCHEVYTSGENIFKIPRTPDIKEWPDGLKKTADYVYRYLETGKYSNDIKSYEAVAIGFVDGDIIELCKNNVVLHNAMSDYLDLIQQT